MSPVFWVVAVAGVGVWALNVVTESDGTEVVVGSDSAVSALTRCFVGQGPVATSAYM
jgi:hypothetical protein